MIKQNHLPSGVSVSCPRILKKKGGVVSALDCKNHVNIIITTCHECNNQNGYSIKYFVVKFLILVRIK